ncbi:hypothetical protein K438DRAFT_676713 [Mycena galopus ATCC 62051]|nr:hypothetical protein K438DRAFT_676713 [Mycena galopus ATCC 62051]
MSCENYNCRSRFSGADSVPEKLLRCSGCHTVQYQACQTADWKQHKQICKLHHPSSPQSGIHFLLEYDEGWSSDDYRENPFCALRTLEVQIRHHAEGAKPVVIGFLKIQIIDLRKARGFEGGFFGALDEMSKELVQLALHFDARGYLKPTSGCWQREEFENEKFLVYLQEISITNAWRGKGVGTWLLPRLFNLMALREIRHIFAWPTEITADNIGNRERIIKMFRKVGFRRIGNSPFFCLAKDPEHPSHRTEDNTVFKELPPATTTQEQIRRSQAEED